MTSIGDYAFSGCSGLTSVTIGNSVESIGSEAFSGCGGLTSVISYIKEPFRIYDSMFSGSSYDNATLYVPKGSKAAYENANGWKKFKKIVEMGGASEEPGDLSGDGEVNGTDLVVLVDVIMAQGEGGSGTENMAADLNGDGEVNGTDLVALVDIIMSIEPSTNHAAARGEMEDSQVKIGVESAADTLDGSHKLNITLFNPMMEVTMVQMDIHLPKGLTLSNNDDVEMAGRTSWKSHSLYTRSLGNNTIRLMLASGRNALIEGSYGDLLRLQLTADAGFEGGDVTFDNILCTSPSLEESRPQAASIYLAANGATGINEMRIPDLTSNEWYNMQGQRVKKPGKGLYIRNGKKVIVK